MSHRETIWVVITTLLCMTSFVVGCEGKGPHCHVTKDLIFKGRFVDCSNRNLTQTDLSSLRFVGVTSLSISNNNIGYLNNYVFNRFKSLKYLMCTGCNLQGMGEYSLVGLKRLEVLYLDSNRLHMYVPGNPKHPAIPPGVFRYVPLLRELYIDNNGEYTLEVSGYSKFLDIFSYLPHLTHLSFDSFSNLRIGHEFLNFPKLYSLRVNCGSLRSISDNSLEGFRTSSIKRFELYGGSLDSPWRHIGLGVFQHLPDISYLSLSYIRVGNKNILAMMKPLVGRNISTIRFESLFTPAFGEFKDKVKDMSVTADDAKYLRNITVANFLWFDSGIYTIEVGVLISKAWRNNLKCFWLVTDALTQPSSDVFLLAFLREIEELSFVWTALGLKIGFTPCGVSSGERPSQRIDSFPDVRGAPKMTSARIASTEPKTSNPKQAIDVSRDRVNGPPFVNKFNRRITQTNNRSNSDDQHRLVYKNRSSLFGIGYSNTTISLPPKLKTLIIDGFHYLRINHIYNILPNQLRSIAFTNSLGPLQFHGAIFGLVNVTSIDFQGSQYLDLSLDFLNGFPNVKHFNLRQTTTTPEFYQSNGKRIIERMTNLERLDLSENGLKILPTDIFLTNKRLRYLNLSGNRFSNLPFDLELTPALETLDLSKNSFVDLSVDDRAAIDKHIYNVNNFKILLGENEIGCSCSCFSLIAWLQIRKKHFDQNGNYSCMSEDGVLSNTGSYSDIRAFWRQCHGGNYLMMSVILACSMVAIYLGIMLGMKNKIALVSQVMRMIVPGFRMKTRWDYRFDVCIAYADRDGDYVKDVLLRYLEDKWFLRTFVHQRDLRQDPLEMSHAIGDSWRCLLLVTESFLYRHHMAHNIMKVTSFLVCPANPRSLVLIVEEAVRHQVPDYVLQVVDDDNILVLPRLDSGIDYETKEFLKDRLVS